MKKTKLILIPVLLLAAVLLLPGCAGETAAPEVPGAAPMQAESPAPDAGEALDIDDSLSFQNTSLYSIEDIIQYVADELYPARMAEFFDGYRAVAADLNSARGGTMIYGWLAFTGTPKTALSWPTTELNGEAVYCRSVNLCTEDNITWTAGKSFAMEPLRLPRLEEYFPTEEAPTDIIIYDRAVKDLVSARLYVSQLEKEYTLTDLAALRELERALSMDSNGLKLITVNTGIPTGCDFYNPMFLEFADGDARLVYTAGDGSNACRLWDEYGRWQIYGTGKSLFELFGVELEAAGYSTEEDRTVIAHCSFRQEMDGRQVYEEAEYHYDGNDRLISYHSFYDPEEVKEKAPFGIDNLWEYEYDDQGRLMEERWYRATARGFGLNETWTNEYDDRGCLIESHCEHGQGEWYRSFSHTYEYDEFGRLIARVYEAGEKTERRIEYWYDDNGLRHQYVVDEFGAQLDPNGENDRPVRRSA